MYVLENCEPRKVFRYFEEISRIPRGSGNEKGVSDYILGFAKAKGMEVAQDDYYNLVIKKPGSSGYENAPAVILQGHMDMVCEKNRDITHNFTKDPIKLVVDGDDIKTRGTTLGADNGIAVAYAMALLDSDDIPHPPLEVVLTADEEAGMSGAMALSPDLVTGKTFINIDSEEEGIFYSSCAGGLKAILVLGCNKMKIKEGTLIHSIFVSGLKGGHSGMDIDKERGNSIRILGRVLYSLSQLFDLNICAIKGGSKDNAIPREAEAIICLNGLEMDKQFNETFERLVKEMQQEYRTSDPNLSIILQAVEPKPEHSFTKEDTEKILTAVLLLPNGIQNMNTNIKGLVETSNNLGVIKTEGQTVMIVCALRSSVITRKYALLDQIRLVGNMVGAELTQNSDYPAWEYDPDSKIRNLFIQTFKEIYGKEPQVTAIHAGLECGLFAEKSPGIDMISFGPDLFDVHTPDERMSISSVSRTWDFLLQVLAKLK